METTGYAVIDKQGNAIWGIGKTADEAWLSFRHEMKMAGIGVVGDPDDDDVALGMDADQTRACDYKVFAATPALLKAVEDLGGNLSFDRTGAVLHLPDEL